MRVALRISRSRLKRSDAQVFARNGLARRWRCWLSRSGTPRALRLPSSRMIPNRPFRRLAFWLAMLVAVQWLAASAAGPAAPDTSDQFNDSHFHLTNYVQEGIDVHQFLRIMGRRV